MRTKLLIFTATILFLSPASKPEVITQTQIPVDTTIFLPCAAGSGELVAVTGNVHAVFSVTNDRNGGVHIHTQFNNAGIRGIGLLTGDKYQVAGGNRFESNATGGMSEFTFTNSFIMTGPGRGNNLYIHELMHVTINANGEITAHVEMIEGHCR
jgi:hypothetical protein